MQNKQQPCLILYLISGIAALNGLLFGFDTGTISGALLFIQKDFVVSTAMQEFIVSSLLLGAMGGALFSGYFVERFGRWYTMIATSVFFIVGTLLATFANHLYFLLLARVLIGFAIGIGSATAPMYIAEISPSTIRGSLVSLNQFTITIGTLFAYIINYTFVNISNAWRWMFFIGLFPAIFLLIGTFFLPESPRWLVKNGMHDKAIKIFQFLGRRSTEIKNEIQDIKNNLTIKQTTFRDILFSKSRFVIFLGIIFGFMQQVTGINIIIYYAPTIFQLAGAHGAANSIFPTIGIGIVNVIATVFAIYYVDKFGRRPLLLVGLIGMCISLFSLSLAFHGDLHTHVLRWITIFCTFSYIFCFAFSLGAMFWLMTSEIFPLNIRGIGMGLTIFSCWFWNFIVSSTFLSLLNMLGPSYTFLLYSCMCVLSFIICYFKVPETKGVSLEEITGNIQKGLALRFIGS